MNLLLMPSLYAGVLESETPPSSAVPTAEPIVEPTTPTPPVIDERLQLIRPDEIEKAAASESQAKAEIPAELSKASQPIYPKP